MPSKDITLLIAHPDDEALFCWPVLDRVKRIVCVVSDRHNPERAWCKERGDCLYEVGRLLGAEVVNLEQNSEFYRLPTRNGELRALANRMIEAVNDAEIIYAHNPWGEYGNLDHILCHHVARTVQAQTGCELLASDIAQEINWLPVRRWSIPVRPDFADAKLDRPLFDRIKAIYDARGCWTWAWEPQATCRVYSL